MSKNFFRGKIKIHLLVRKVLLIYLSINVIQYKSLVTNDAIFFSYLLT